MREGEREGENNGMVRKEKERKEVVREGQK